MPWGTRGGGWVSRFSMARALRHVLGDVEERLMCGETVPSQDALDLLRLTEGNE